MPHFAGQVVRQRGVSLSGDVFLVGFGSNPMSQNNNLQTGVGGGRGVCHFSNTVPSSLTIFFVSKMRAISRARWSDMLVERTRIVWREPWIVAGERIFLATKPASVLEIGSSRGSREGVVVVVGARRFVLGGGRERRRRHERFGADVGDVGQDQGRSDLGRKQGAGSKCRRFE